jgi:hypothetical protein
MQVEYEERREVPGQRMKLRGQMARALMRSKVSAIGAEYGLDSECLLTWGIINVAAPFRVAVLLQI